MSSKGKLLVQEDGGKPEPMFADDLSLAHAMRYARAWLARFAVSADLGAQSVLRKPSEEEGEHALIILNTLAHRYEKEHGQQSTGVITKRPRTRKA